MGYGQVSVQLRSNHGEISVSSRGIEGLDFHTFQSACETKPSKKENCFNDLMEQGMDSCYSLLVICSCYQTICVKKLSWKMHSILHTHFLPVLKGRRPYHQDVTGVKLIGAPLHYVTADLERAHY